MMRNSLRRLVVALAIGLVPLGTSLSAATAVHLGLKRSQPAKDSVLSASPAAIKLWFSEAPEIGLTTITLTAATGATVSLETPKGDPSDKTLVIATLQTPLTPGGYTVGWRTASRDGHAVRGTIPFTVAAKKASR